MDPLTSPPAIPPGRRPCAFALGAMGVPARRWSTRTDLYVRLDEAKSHLDRCPLDSGSLDEAAAVAGLSRHHFLRLFHEIYGITPHKHLTTRRLLSAEEILLNEGLSIGEVAVSLGFVSQSAFGRAFKKHSGISPSAYRRLKLGNRGGSSAHGLQISNIGRTPSR